MGHGSPPLIEINIKHSLKAKELLWTHIVTPCQKVQYFKASHTTIA